MENDVKKLYKWAEWDESSGRLDEPIATRLCESFDSEEHAIEALHHEGRDPRTLRNSIGEFVLLTIYDSSQPR
jgi:hypothetical protein